MLNQKQFLTVLVWNIAKILIAFLVGSLAVYTLTQKISQVSKSLEEERTSITILENRGDSFTLLRDSFVTVGKADVQVENAFPDPENIVPFTAALNGLADRSSVSQTLNYGAASGNYIDYTLNVNGNIAAWIAYLKSFERLPFMTTISSLTLTSSDKNGWEGNSNLILQGRVYTNLTLLGE